MIRKLFIKVARRALCLSSSHNMRYTDEYRSRRGVVKADKVCLKCGKSKTAWTGPTIEDIEQATGEVVPPKSYVYEKLFNPEIEQELIARAVIMHPVTTEYVHKTYKTLYVLLEQDQMPSSQEKIIDDIAQLAREGYDPSRAGYVLYKKYDEKYYELDY